MAREWIEDDSGEGMWMRRGSNNRFIGNTFDPKATENIANVSLRPDDILLCCYAKTGTHWIWENIRMLLTGEIQFDKVEKESMMMEYFEQMDKLPSPRILNNHAFFDEQPKDLLQCKNKVIFLYRNPKDVALSLYHHHLQLPSYEYNGIFKNFQKRFLQGKVLNGSYLDYLKSWDKGLREHSNIPCHFIRYEDFHQKPILERRRLAGFLSRQYEDEFLQQVADATSMDTMRRLKAEHTPKLIGSDGMSIVYRKGKVGDWKEHFTVNESAQFDEFVDRELKDTELFDFVYSLDDQ